jgi:hypothetical protein
MIFGDFKIRLRSLLQEPEGDGTGTTYPNQILFEATCAAIDAVLPWCPNLKIASLVSEGTSKSVPLPADCYRIEAVEDARNIMLPKAVLTPGSIRPAEGTSTTASIEIQPADWIEFPTGYLRFSLLPSSGEAFRLYYQAYFAHPADEDDDDFELTVPQSVLTAMLYYAAAHSILPSSVASAQIRQFNTRIDSGQPVDNVLEQSARFFRQLFIDEMSRQPRYIGIPQ